MAAGNAHYAGLQRARTRQFAAAGPARMLSRSAETKRKRDKEKKKMGKENPANVFLWLGLSKQELGYPLQVFPGGSYCRWERFYAGAILPPGILKNARKDTDLPFSLQNETTHILEGLIA